MPQQSKFLVIEGCNGVGKSTIVEYLKARTGASAFHYPPQFVDFRREINLDASVKPLPRLIYYLAATLHLSDLVCAHLAKGHVICDRYLASPLSLMIAEAAIEEAEALRHIKAFESYLRMPDLTLLLRANHAKACARIRDRSRKSGKRTRVSEKTLESEEFFQKREDTSRRLAMKLGPLVELDTTHLSAREMCSSAWSLLAPRLKW